MRNYIYWRRHQPTTINTTVFYVRGQYLCFYKFLNGALGMAAIVFVYMVIIFVSGGDDYK